jgi:hypothetical protein
MTEDDGGVLGNLPRSRPGHRSKKRTGRTAAKAAAHEATSASDATPPPSERRAAPPVSAAGDPVGDAIRTVTGVAATGARVAGGVAREVLRRLPRP